MSELGVALAFAEAGIAIFRLGFSEMARDCASVLTLRRGGSVPAPMLR